MCQWNVRGMTPDVKTHLNHIVTCRKPDVFLLSELYTLWNANRRDYSWDDLRSYQVFKQDHGFGKVATLVRDDVGHRQVEIEPAWNAEIDQEIAALTCTGAELVTATKDLEKKKLYVVVLELWNSAERWLVVNCYRSQGTNGKGCSLSKLATYVDRLHARTEFRQHKILLGGDLNAHHDSWTDRIVVPGNPTSNEGVIFERWRVQNNYFLLNDRSHTRIGSIRGGGITRTAPDVTVCSSNVNVRDVDWWTEDQGRKTSDHLNIFITVRGSAAFSEQDPDEFVIRNGAKLDWCAYKDRVQRYKREWDKAYGINLQSAMEFYHAHVKEHKDQEKAREAATSRFGIDAALMDRAVGDFIDKVLVAAARDEFGVRRKTSASWPWMTKEIKSTIDKRDAYWNVFRTWSSAKRWYRQPELDDLTAEMDRVCARGHIDYIEKELTPLGDGAFCSYSQISNLVNKDSKSTQRVPAWFDANGELEAETSLEKACAYHDGVVHMFDANAAVDPGVRTPDTHFDAQVDKLWCAYKQRRRSRIDEIKHKQELALLNAPLSRAEIRRSLFASKPNSASGDDGLLHKHMQCSFEVIETSLGVLYNSMILLHFRPPRLNRRVVRILPKGGKKKSSKFSWRPISLQSTFGKPLDRIMSSRMTAFAVKIGIIRANSFGFIKGLGTVDAVIVLIDLIDENLLKRRCASHIVLFDFKAAFDTINHKMFLRIVKVDFGITGNVLRYFELCLSNRWGRVKVQGVYSPWRPDLIGVGQGWPPSAICYLWVTADLDLVNELGLDLTLLLYADDSTLIYTGNGDEKTIERELNFAIRVIGYISSKLGLILQTSKQKYFVVGPGSHSTRRWPDMKELYLNLHLNGELLTKEYKSITYLGLRIDPRMTWSTHVNYVA